MFSRHKTHNDPAEVDAPAHMSTTAAAVYAPMLPAATYTTATPFSLPTPPLPSLPPAEKTHSPAVLP